MLKIHVKRDEKVIIKFGEQEVELFVSSIRRQGCSILFTAPREVQISRENAKNKTQNIQGEKNESAEI